MRLSVAQVKGCGKDCSTSRQPQDIFNFPQLASTNVIQHVANLSEFSGSHEWNSMYITMLAPLRDLDSSLLKTMLLLLLIMSKRVLILIKQKMECSKGGSKGRKCRWRCDAWCREASLASGGVPAVVYLLFSSQSSISHQLSKAREKKCQKKEERQVEETRDREDEKRTESLIVQG